MFSSSCALPSPASAGVAFPCSVGSQVVRRSPTSPARACPPFGLWPSRTGLRILSKACWRSPGSRACCFLTCAGSSTTQDRTATRDNAAAVLPSSYSEGSRHPDLSAFRSSITPPINASGLRFETHLTVGSARLEVRMESLFPFPVGLLHPLQHAGCSENNNSSRLRSELCGLDNLH